MATASALTDQAPLGQDPVHLAFRAQVDALIHQRQVHLGRGQITEPFRAQHGTDLVAFIVGDSPRHRQMLVGRLASRRLLGQATLSVLAAVTPRPW